MHPPDYAATPYQQLGGSRELEALAVECGCDPRAQTLRRSQSQQLQSHLQKEQEEEEEEEEGTPSVSGPGPALQPEPPVRADLVRRG